MKFFEITIRPDRITVRHEAEQRLTAEQRFWVLQTVIICGTVLGFFALVASVLPVR